MLNLLDCESSAAMATQSCSSKLFRLLHGTECRVDCPRCEWKLEAPEIVDCQVCWYSSQSTFISSVTRLFSVLEREFRRIGCSSLLCGVVGEAVAVPVLVRSSDFGQGSV